MKNKYLLRTLMLLNVVVLIGQLWPEGAPPFARVVNVVFLLATLAVFSLALLEHTSRSRQ